MPTQKELLDSAKKIDDRLSKAKSLIKDHKRSKSEAVKRGTRAKAKSDAAKSAALI